MTPTTTKERTMRAEERMMDRFDILVRQNERLGLGKAISVMSLVGSYDPAEQSANLRAVARLVRRGDLIRRSNPSPNCDDLIELGDRA